VTGAGLLIGVLFPGINLNHAAAGSAGVSHFAHDGGALIVVQLSTAALWALAAVGFARRSVGNPHARTLGWLAVSAILAAWWRIDTLLGVPVAPLSSSLCVLLRTGSMLALGVAAVYECTVTVRGVRESAVEVERRRLARELHDGLAQELAFIVSRTRRSPAAGIEPATLDDIGSAAESALDQSRMAIYELRHPESRRWIDAVEARAHSLARRGGLELQFEAKGELRLDAELEHGLVAIIQEAISNAARHAAATKINISICTNGGAVIVQISDDGCGFPPVKSEPTPHGGLGLAGMHERAQELGGELSFESVPGYGTTIKLAF
jgi:signal transduction histidine kinase